MPLVELLGLVGAVAMPLWNLPLIVRIQKRRSSRDLSLSWALGIWACLLLMLPSGLVSADPVYRAFTVANVLMFTVVVLQVLRFRRGPD